MSQAICKKQTEVNPEFTTGIYLVQNIAFFYKRRVSHISCTVTEMSLNWSNKGVQVESKLAFASLSGTELYNILQ